MGKKDYKWHDERCEDIAETIMKSNFKWSYKITLLKVFEELIEK